MGTDTLLWQSCGATSQMQCTQPHSKHMPSGYSWRCGAADGLGAKSYASGSSSLLDGGSPSHTVVGGSQGRALGPTFGVRGAADVLLARFSSRAASSSFGVPRCLDRTYVRTYVRTPLGPEASWTGMPKVTWEKHATNTQTVFGKTLNNGPGPLGGNDGRDLSGLDSLSQLGPSCQGHPGPVHGLVTTRTRTYDTARSPTGPRLAASRQ